MTVSEFEASSDFCGMGVFHAARVLPPDVSRRLVSRGRPRGRV